MTACAVRRNGLSRSPTVGCGVFAVRAKISPPVATMRRRALCSVAARRAASFIGGARFYDARRPTERKWQPARCVAMA